MMFCFLYYQFFAQEMFSLMIFIAPLMKRNLYKYKLDNR